MNGSASISRQGRHDYFALAGILLLFVVLGLSYSFAVPIFEKPDEIFHYAFARTLAQGNPLPVQTIQADGPWSHEGTQAPLYYLLVGRLTSTIDQSDFDQLAVQNPHANLGSPLSPGNKNYMLYSARALPLRGTNLAVHVGRWFSLALGCLTIFLAYLTGVLAFPGSSRLPLLSALLIASIPQFAFISSSVSNDLMITVTSTAVIYWLARLVTRDQGDPVSWWEWSVLGVCLGLAALSKLQGLVLLAPTIIVILWKAWKRKSWQLLLASAALVLLPALAIAGWWYWRNFNLYGEWLGTRTLLTINGLRTTQRSWRGFVGEMRGMRYSFWALFGWFSIILPGWVYRILDAVTIFALAGLGLAGLKSAIIHKRALFEQPAARVKSLLLLWAVILTGFMLYWSSFATSSQGRLLFPLLSALGVLMVTGLSFWAAFLPNRWRLAALMLLPAGLVGCSLYTLAVVLPDAYRARGAIPALPEDVRPLNLTFDDQVELVGIRLPGGRFVVGEAVPITLYLKGNQKLTADLPLFIQLLDENAAPIGNVTTHPGWGRNPTSLWEPGLLYEDHYSVTISEPIDSHSPLGAVVYVGFTPPDSTLPLAARTVEGAEASGMVGQVDVVPSRQPDLAALGLTPADVSFDDGVRLIGRGFPESVQISENHLPVTLLWEARTPPTQDYIAFVHLLDSEGKQVSGHDQPPAAGRFPTDRWQGGDRIVSEFSLSLPPGMPGGVYHLWAGLYPVESEGRVRLGITNSDQAVQDQSVLLGTVEVK